MNRKAVFLIARDTFVQRLDAEHAGYWQANGEGVETFTRSEWALALDELAHGVRTHSGSSVLSGTRTASRDGPLIGWSSTAIRRNSRASHVCGAPVRGHRPTPQLQPGCGARGRSPLPAVFCELRAEVSPAVSGVSHVSLDQTGRNRPDWVDYRSIPRC